MEKRRRSSIYEFRQKRRALCTGRKCPVNRTRRRKVDVRLNFRRRARNGKSRRQTFRAQPEINRRASHQTDSRRRGDERSRQTPETYQPETLGGFPTVSHDIIDKSNK